MSTNDRTNDPGDGQEVGLDDVEVSESAPIPAREASRLPPPLPPTASILPTQPGGPLPEQSLQPPQPTLTSPPAPAGRSPLFYVGIILAVLVVSLGAGTVVLRAMRKPAVAATPAPSGGAAGPRVITIPVQDMDDPTDAGP